ncbi:MAG TPA: hypothetical protein VGP93_10675 [Polyangiaceae bacterium]|nr:hypothetical protein [Polyangiaceae bacterium]
MLPRRVGLILLLVAQFAACSGDDTQVKSGQGGAAGAEPNGGASGSVLGFGGEAGSANAGSAGAELAGAAGAPAGGAGSAGASNAGASNAGATQGGAGGAGGIAAGGEGGAGIVSAPVTPTEANGTYTFAYGDVVFEVDADVGGRVITYSKAGVDLIDDSDATNYGSTFWPSPQSAWGWPPPAEIDNLAYSAALDGATLVLTSGANAALELSASKRFTVDSGFDRVTIEYALKNEGAGAISVAPWEITRVDIDGITFFPAPTAPITVQNGFPYDYDATGLATWFDYAAESPTMAGKLFQDGSGWLAHADPNNSLLLVKVFPDIAPVDFAAGESEVELYTDAASYVELENQGAYVSLAAGESLTYTVLWYLRAIPGTVTIASRDTSLYDMAANLAQ